VGVLIRNIERNALNRVEVVFCDNHLLVALKPSGMLTQESESIPSVESFCKLWIKNQYSKQGAVFLHCIHRLDKQASGLVFLARTQKALSRLNEQSRSQKIQRIYIAEVEGRLKQTEGELENYLVHGDHRSFLVSKEDKRGKRARLLYRVLARKRSTTVVEVTLETGRYHQIRVQFGALDHPIVGDRRYGSQINIGNSIRLHCQKLSFEHPTTKKMLYFEKGSDFFEPPHG